MIGLLLCGGDEGWRERMQEFLVGFGGRDFAVVFGDEEPFEGFLALRVGGLVHAEEVAEVCLGFGLILKGGFKEPCLGLIVFFFRSISVAAGDADHVLGNGIARLGGLQNEGKAFFAIRHHESVAYEVELTEGSHGIGVSSGGGFFHPLEAFRVVGGGGFSLAEHEAEVECGLGGACFGALAEPLDRLGFVLFKDDALGVEKAQTGERIGVSLFGGSGNPFEGLGIVGGRAFAPEVGAAELELGGGVACGGFGFERCEGIFVSTQCGKTGEEDEDGFHGVFGWMV